MITHYIVQTSNGYWGRADSVRAAELLAKDHGGKLRHYVIIRITQEADKPTPWIDKYGGLWHYANPFNGDVETTVVKK